MQILALKTVLAATDLRDDSLPTLRAAHTISRAAGATLHVVHVGPVDSGGGEATHAQLGRIGVPLNQATVHTVPGEPASGILSIARELCADVIVIGPHGRGRFAEQRADVGTALRIATGALVPCLIVGEQAHIPVRRVIVALDGSDTSLGAMQVALSWTSGLRGSRISGDGETTLVGLHVDNASRTDTEHAEVRTRAEQRIAKLREDAGTWAGVHIDYEVVRATNVARAIAQFSTSHGADLVVMGTRGLGLDDTPRLGSISSAVTEQLRLPLLLIPPAVWHRLVPGSARGAQVDDCASEPVR